LRNFICEEYRDQTCKILQDKQLMHIKNNITSDLIIKLQLLTCFIYLDECIYIHHYQLPNQRIWIIKSWTL